MTIEEDVVNQITNQQKVFVTVESHTMNVEFHLGTVLHASAELQNEVEEHFDSKISVHERDVELPDREVHND